MQRNFAAAIEELKGLINEWSAFSADAPVLLLAVSGGVDSMCMADLFQSLEDRVPFAVAHCNFCLRGEESDGDEALVAEWAREHSVPLHITSFDTEKYASENGISIEMAARELRYGWFASLCSQHGYKAVAVAHNANDNAETLLLNLLRGSGLKGVTGMSLTSPLPCAPGSAALLLRPLLKCTRKQIEGYAFAHKVRYREDRTNAMSEYKRNRLRNDVFPIFESINPSFVRTLNREASYFEDASGIVEDYCRAASEKIVSTSGDRLTISLPALLAASRWRYILYYILEPFGFNSAVLASLENLLLSERTVSGKRFESPTHILFTEREHLRVEPSESQASVVPCAQVEDIMPVRCAGTYHFNGAVVTVEEVDRTPDMPLKQPEGTLLFDAQKLRFPLVLRRWRDGDWLVPFGMRGKKKVSDLFADLKYDSLKKSSAVVLVDTVSDSMAQEGHIAAVLGVRSDDRYKVVSTTVRAIRVSVTR
ncbi:MAG: tRNA lysidine(34) synthetase TilS [Bacteroidales bacterium]|nr:tRNA lysidine(34) synthetase TilS [Bacteroidales bacterium]